MDYLNRHLITVGFHRIVIAYLIWFGVNIFIFRKPVQKRDR